MKKTSRNKARDPLGPVRTRVPLNGQRGDETEDELRHEEEREDELRHEEEREDELRHEEEREDELKT